MYGTFRLKSVAYVILQVYNHSEVVFKVQTNLNLEASAGGHGLTFGCSSEFSQARE